MEITLEFSSHHAFRFNLENRDLQNCTGELRLFETVQEIYLRMSGAEEPRTIRARDLNHVEINLNPRFAVTAEQARDAA